MDLQTINQVSKEYGVSARMLRYYEKIGLIQSSRKVDYAYRVYDETALRRLHQIIILRKLRIPMKHIEVILTDPMAAKAIEIFEKNISELDDEINALSTIRNILIRLSARLKEQVNVRLEVDTLMDSSVSSIVGSLQLSKNHLKEDAAMDDLRKASEKLNRLTDKDVRIVYLPPSTVAAYQYEGEDPEMHVHQVMSKFVIESNLMSIKSDLRHYGFNAPNPVDETNRHGYEVWITIPDDFPVPAPLVKKHFEGGLYAAHMIPFGAFEEWEWLSEWVANNPKYEANYGGKGYECMYGCLEESLNYVNRVHLENPESDDFQLDLLLPVKERAAK